MTKKNKKLDLKNEQMTFGAYETPTSSFPGKKAILELCRLASNKDMTFDAFLEDVKAKYDVDTSAFPKTKDGDVIYPDGKIGVDIDLTPDEEMQIHQAAYTMNISTNEFVNQAVQAALDEHAAQEKSKKKKNKTKKK